MAPKPRRCGSRSAATNISEIVPTLGRQFEISLGVATDLIRAGASGLDVVQISGNTVSTEEQPFVQLIVGRDSGIDGITDLAGKRVASPTLSGPIHMATLYWAQDGIDPSAIDAVQVPPPNLADQLQAGEVDAVEALEPFASVLLANDNVSLGNPFAAIGRGVRRREAVDTGEPAGPITPAAAGVAGPRLLRAHGAGHRRVRRGLAGADQRRDPQRSVRTDPPAPPPTARPR